MAINDLNLLFIIIYGATVVKFLVTTASFIIQSVRSFINIMPIEFLDLFIDLAALGMPKDVDMLDESSDNFDYSKIDSIFYKYANCKFFKSLTSY